MVWLSRNCCRFSKRYKSKAFYINLTNSAHWAPSEFRCFPCPPRQGARLPTTTRCLLVSKWKLFKSSWKRAGCMVLCLHVSRPSGSGFVRLNCCFYNKSSSGVVRFRSVPVSYVHLGSIRLYLFVIGFANLIGIRHGCTFTIIIIL